jgi:hypothetical protein
MKPNEMLAGSDVHQAQLAVAAPSESTSDLQTEAPELPGGPPASPGCCAGKAAPSGVLAAWAEKQLEQPYEVDPITGGRLRSLKVSRPALAVDSGPRSALTSSQRAPKQPVLSLEHPVEVDPVTGRALAAHTFQLQEAAVPIQPPGGVFVDPTTGRAQPPCTCPFKPARAQHIALAAEVDPTTGRTIPETVPYPGNTVLTPGIGFYPNYPWEEDNTPGCKHKRRLPTLEDSVALAKKAGITRTPLYVAWTSAFYVHKPLSASYEPCPWTHQVDKSKLEEYITPFLHRFVRPLMDHVGAANFHLEIAFIVHDPRVFAKGKPDETNGILFPCQFSGLGLKDHDSDVAKTITNPSIVAAAAAFNAFYDVVYDVLCGSECREANFIMSLGSEVDLYIQPDDPDAWAGYTEFYRRVSQHAKATQSSTPADQRLGSVSVGVTVNYPNVLNLINAAANKLAKDEGLSWTDTFPVVEQLARENLAKLNQHSDVVIFNYYPRASWKENYPTTTTDLLARIEFHFVHMMNIISAASSKAGVPMQGMLQEVGYPSTDPSNSSADFFDPRSDVGTSYQADFVDAVFTIFEKYSSPMSLSACSITAMSWWSLCDYDTWTNVTQPDKPIGEDCECFTTQVWDYKKAWWALTDPTNAQFCATGMCASGLLFTSPNDIYNIQDKDSFKPAWYRFFVRCQQIAAAWEASP